MSQNGTALTKDETAFVVKVLENARLGRATMSDLARAYLLADRAEMKATIAELRKWISITADHHGPPLIFMFGFGIAVGITTHFILKKMGQQR